LTANTDRVREVRLSVLTRTAQADPLMNGNGRQGVANRNGAATAPVPETSSGAGS
jgi:hypothetical protein